MNATELVAYDQAKQTFLKAGMPDNIPTHILSGLTAGLAATLLGSPVDVIKVNIAFWAALCVDWCVPSIQILTNFSVAVAARTYVSLARD